MKTDNACLACFLKQARYTVGLLDLTTDFQDNLLTKADQIINNFDLTYSPPINSVKMYDFIAQYSGITDPFAHLKSLGNCQALQVKDSIKALIYNAADPLFTAIQYAIAGNIIDYGSHQDFNLEKTLIKCRQNPLVLNSYEDFTKDLKESSRILYLADNCGEIVFDSLLIEQLPGKTTIAVKEKAILNDALLEDAYFCGLDKHCEIITNGTNCPGTPLEHCSNLFLQMYENADLIISKGQGNFETLNQANKPIYFLLTIKCQVVADQVKLLSGTSNDIKIGDAVFIKKERQTP